MELSAPVPAATMAAMPGASPPRSGRPRDPRPRSGASATPPPLSCPRQGGPGDLPTRRAVAVARADLRAAGRREAGPEAAS